MIFNPKNGTVWALGAAIPYHRGEQRFYGKHLKKYNPYITAKYTLLRYLSEQFPSHFTVRMIDLFMLEVITPNEIVEITLNYHGKILEFGVKGTVHQRERRYDGFGALLEDVRKW